MTVRWARGEDHGFHVLVDRTFRPCYFLGCDGSGGFRQGLGRVRGDSHGCVVVSSSSLDGVRQMLLERVGAYIPARFPNWPLDCKVCWRIRGETPVRMATKTA